MVDWVSFTSLIGYGIASFYLWFVSEAQICLIIGFLSFIYGFLSLSESEQKVVPIETPLDEDDETDELSTMKIGEDSNDEGEDFSEEFDRSNIESGDSIAKELYLIEVFQANKMVGYLSAVDNSHHFIVTPQYTPNEKFHFQLYSRPRHGDPSEIHALKNIFFKAFISRSHLRKKCKTATSFKAHESINMKTRTWISYKNCYKNPRPFYLDNQKSLCVGDSSHPLEFNLKHVDTI
jgi:hypothetical protein